MSADVTQPAHKPDTSYCASASSQRIGPTSIPVHHRCCAALLNESTFFQFPSWCCHALQVLPVERGKGMDQPGMRAAEQRLAAGDWVHIFPEGTRSRDGSSMGALR